MAQPRLLFHISSLFSFTFEVLGIKPGALYIPGKCSTARLHYIVGLTSDLKISISFVRTETKEILAFGNILFGFEANGLFFFFFF